MTGKLRQHGVRAELLRRICDALEHPREFRELDEEQFKPL
jgi:hypothetical protein